MLSTFVVTAQEVNNSLWGFEATSGIKVECECHNIAHKPPLPWSTLLPITAHLFGVAVLTLASLTSQLNDALRIVTGCLGATPTDNLFVLSEIQPTELCRQKVILSLARRAQEPAHHHKRRVSLSCWYLRQLKLRYPFVPAALELLYDLAQSGISVVQ